MAVLLYRSPPIGMVTFAGAPHFVEVPLLTKPRTAATELIRVLLPELATPLAEGFLRLHDSTFVEQLFPIPEAQPKSEVQPSRVAKNLHRQAGFLVVGADGVAIP